MRILAGSVTSLYESAAADAHLNSCVQCDIFINEVKLMLSSDNILLFLM